MAGWLLCCALLLLVLCVPSASALEFICTFAQIPIGKLRVCTVILLKNMFRGWLWCFVDGITAPHRTEEKSSSRRRTRIWEGFSGDCVSISSCVPCVRVTLEQFSKCTFQFRWLEGVFFFCFLCFLHFVCQKQNERVVMVSQSSNSGGDKMWHFC